MCESDADNFIKLCSVSIQLALCLIYIFVVSTILLKDMHMSHVPSAAGPRHQKDTHPVLSSPDPQPLKDTPHEEAGPIEITLEHDHEDTNGNHTLNVTIRADDEQHKDDITRDDVTGEENPTDNDNFATDLQSPNSLLSETSFETSVGSIKSEGELSSDSEVMELFQPSSPFKIKEEFILPDIIEEAEGAETDSLGNTLENSFQDCDRSSLHSSLDDGDLDIMETSFSEATLSRQLISIGRSDTNPNLDPPMLPVSPPPGPLLSPELDVVSNAHQQPPYKGGYDTGGMKSYRHSVAGMLEDIPPPLPLMGPPGKMISPRHSRFIDLADFSAPNSMRELDVSQLVLKMSRMTSEVESKDPPLQKLNEDKVSVKFDEVLPPLLQDYPNGDFDTSDPSIIRQRLGSYHLKTFEPPKEFSDSGFQDTDMNTSPKTAVVLAKPTFISREDEKFGSPLSALTQKVDSSVTGTSDEQLTENSGSVGLKTLASSGSEVSIMLVLLVSSPFPFPRWLHDDRSG